MTQQLNQRRPNVYLARLSPKQQLSIQKPLLSRTTSKYLTKNKDGEISLGQMTQQELETIQNQQMLMYQNQTHFSSRFQNTFGFSHGIGGTNYVQHTDGGIKTGKNKRSPKLRVKGKEPKMQVCFSIASGGSTMTRRMDESFSIIPDIKSNLNTHQLKDAASRLDAQQQAQIIQMQDPCTNSPSQQKMASQLRIMDELGKVCRDSPISIVESQLHLSDKEHGNQKKSQAFSMMRHDTQKSLGFRQPDNPVQLISYLAKQKKNEIYNRLPQRQPLMSNSKKKLATLVSDKQQLRQDSQASLGSPSGKIQDSPPKMAPKEPFSANCTHYGTKKIPALLPQHVGAMYQTMNEFGSVPLTAGGQTNKSSQKRLPRIIFALAEETDDDTLSQLTAVRNTVFFPGGPKLNNPLLPVHLNRDLSTITSPLEKKFELPPQATIAIYNEKDGMVCNPPLVEGDDQLPTYQPKWTKVAKNRNHLSPRTQALPSPQTTVSVPKRNQSVPRPRMPPAFMITSSTSVSKKMGAFPRREDGREQPFVGNYNVPKQPFTLPDGTVVQANPLKNTFTKFSEQAQSTFLASKEQKTKSSLSNPGSAIKKASIRVIAGDREIVVDSERQQEALIQAVRRISAERAVRKDQIFSQLRSQYSEQTEHRSGSPGGSSNGNSANGGIKTPKGLPVKPPAMSITFAQMREQYKRRGTFYQNQGDTSRPSPMGTPGDASTTDMRRLEPTLNDCSCQDMSIKSPPFTFQANSPTSRKPTNERAFRNTTQDQIKNLNPKEVKRLLFQTMNLSQEKDFSTSVGLKIQGQNLGHNPSSNLMYQTRQALELGKQQGVQTMSRPFLSSSAAPQEGQYDSQAALNADLMLNNIYKSEEFLEKDGADKAQKPKKEQEGGSSRAQVSPTPILKQRLDSKSSLDMKEPEGSLASIAEAGRQPAIKTPSRGCDLAPVAMNTTSQSDLNVNKNPSELEQRQPSGLNAPATASKHISQTAINAITRDLDVETNYLRNSAANFVEELPMKTVFQKRGPLLADEQSSIKAKNVNQTIKEELNQASEQTLDVMNEQQKS